MAMLAFGTTPYQENYQRYREVMRQYMHARSRWWGLIGKPNENLYSAGDFLSDAPRLPFVDRFTIRINGKAISDVESDLARFDRLPWIIRFLHPYGHSYYQKNRALLCAYYMNELIRYRATQAEQATPNLRVEALFAWSGFLEHRRRLNPFSRMRNGFKDFELTVCSDNTFKEHLIVQPKIGFFQKTIRMLGDFAMMWWKKMSGEVVKPQVSQVTKEELQDKLQAFADGFKNWEEGYRQLKNDAHHNAHNKGIAQNNLRTSLKKMTDDFLAKYGDTRWDGAHEPTRAWLLDAREQFTRLYRQYIARLDDIDSGVLTSTAVVMSSFALSSSENTATTSVTGTLSDGFKADKGRVDALAKRFAAQIVVATTTSAAEALYAEYLKEEKQLYREFALKYHPDRNAGKEEEAKICFVELNHHLAVKKGNLFELLASGGQAAVKAQNFGFFGGYQSMSAWLDRLEKGFKKIEAEQKELWELYRRYEIRTNERFKRQDEIIARMEKRLAEINEEIKDLPKLAQRMREDDDRALKEFFDGMCRVFRAMGYTDEEICRQAISSGLDPVKYGIDLVALGISVTSDQQVREPTAEIVDVAPDGDDRSDAVVGEVAAPSADAGHLTGMQL